MEAEQPRTGSILQADSHAFGGPHHESHPLVAFCARREHVALLLAVAARAGVGMENNEMGEVMVYTDDIRRMPVFAAALLENRDLFDGLSFSDSEAGDSNRA
ncbi:hypothetical protein [Sphingomonas hengshuiensis]|uniref:hypothetical protein n=1 Tax=Sphingomonas hengshuiensis TaxID=1609977 RepID=UPI000A8FE972|nr:hypothetical protein [Sphingomonas hengshuiensis]